MSISTVPSLASIATLVVAGGWLTGCGGSGTGWPSSTSSASSPTNVTDLRPQWDTARVLRNPYKGWYHHYYDNGTRNYRLGADADLDHFPGMDHLYIRLSWAHFEPEEGRFDWTWIDQVKNHWVPKGYGISLRISTSETGEEYATPTWVSAAGAKGAMLGAYRQQVWVPDYADPIFLAKLEQFVKALGDRYDGEPWLRYVDIGLGTWGEGHNFPMVDAAIPVAAVKSHIDIYRRHFKRSVLVLSDDAVHVHGRTSAQEQDLLNYALANDLSWRDDSILTWPGLHNWPETFNVARPALFESAWRRFPTVLETSHYHEAVRDGAYKTTASGSIRAYDDMRASAKLTHATYMGYHGDAAKWLTDHSAFARELANSLGYWYFPRTISTPQVLPAGGRAIVSIVWENHGTACAYKRFALRAKLTGYGKTIVLPLADSDNRTWMPETATEERYLLALPAAMLDGKYDLSIGLFDTSAAPERVIEIGARENLRDRDGYYRVTQVGIERAR